MFYPTSRDTGNPLNPVRGRDRGLQLFPANEEFPVVASHNLAAIKSLPFVHTARRYYRSSGSARTSYRLAGDPLRAGPPVQHAVLCRGKSTEPDRLEEVKVVTRFP